MTSIADVQLNEYLFFKTFFPTEKKIQKISFVFDTHIILWYSESERETFARPPNHHHQKEEEEE